MELVYAGVILILAAIVIYLIQRNNKQRESELKEEVVRLTRDKESLQMAQLEHVKEIPEKNNCAFSKKSY